MDQLREGGVPDTLDVCSAERFAQLLYSPTLADAFETHATTQEPAGTLVQSSDVTQEATTASSWFALHQVAQTDEEKREWFRLDPLPEGGDNATARRAVLQREASRYAVAKQIYDALYRPIAVAVAPQRAGRGVPQRRVVETARAPNDPSTVVYLPCLTHHVLPAMAQGINGTLVSRVHDQESGGTTAGRGAVLTVWPCVRNCSVTSRSQAFFLVGSDPVLFRAVVFQLFHALLVLRRRLPGFVHGNTAQCVGFFVADGKPTLYHVAGAQAYRLTTSLTALLVPASTSTWGAGNAWQTPHENARSFCDDLYGLAAAVYTAAAAAYSSGSQDVTTAATFREAQNDAKVPAAVRATAKQLRAVVHRLEQKVVAYVDGGGAPDDVLAQVLIDGPFFTECLPRVSLHPHDLEATVRKRCPLRTAAVPVWYGPRLDRDQLAALTASDSDTDGVVDDDNDDPLAWVDSLAALRRCTRPVSPALASEQEIYRIAFPDAASVPWFLA